GALWVGTDLGLAILADGLVRLPTGVPDSLSGPILGIAEDQDRQLWISTPGHILRVDRVKLSTGPIDDDADVRDFGLADGLRSVEGVRRDRSVLVDSSHRIWISTAGGLSMVDPGQVRNRSVPAIVRVEKITVDGNAVDSSGPVHISSARQRITFTYAGLSLSVPERVRFKYRLDDFDHAWSEAVTTREAPYTNLGPGTYRFRVIAS